MSKILSSMLLKCRKSSHLCWWNVYHPIIYADEMSKTLSSMLMKCLKPSHLCWWNVYNPLIYTDEMSTTLSSMSMKCLNGNISILNRNSPDAPERTLQADQVGFISSRFMQWLQCCSCSRGCQQQDQDDRKHSSGWYWQETHQWGSACRHGVWHLFHRW